MTYQLWSKHFRSDLAFMSKLREASYVDDANIHIHYIHEGYNSKRLNDTFDLEGHAIQTATQLFGDEKFLVHFNKKENDKEWWSDHFKGMPNAEECPRIPHGLNEFDHINNIHLPFSLEPTKPPLDFLRDIGIRNISDALYHQNGFQAVMRTAVRDPAKADQIKRFIVMDKSYADYLQKQFPRATIDACGVPAAPGLNEAILKQRTHCSAKSRQTKLLDGLRMTGNKCHWLKGNPIEESLIVFDPADDISGNREFFHNPSSSSYGGTIYKSTKHKKPDQYVADLPHLLREAYVREDISTKDQQGLISPAVFDPSLGSDNEWRTYQNIKYMSKWSFLDFDGGDLTPEAFSELFPELQMVLYSSWNHSASSIRFRAVISLSEQPTVDSYKAIVGIIEQKLKAAGYWTCKRPGRICPTKYKKSGLDWGKQVATALFYLPSNKADSFFYEFTDNRQPLDVARWLKDNLLYDEKPYHEPKGKVVVDVDESAVIQATIRWRESSQHPGTGNAAFWIFALALRAAGLSQNQIERTLRSEAVFALHPKERVAQIPSIIASMRNYKHKGRLVDKSVVKNAKEGQQA